MVRQCIVNALVLRILSVAVLDIPPALQDEEEDIADLQGMLNILASVKLEEAKAMDADRE